MPNRNKKRFYLSLACFIVFSLCSACTTSRMDYLYDTNQNINNGQTLESNIVNIEMENFILRQNITNGEKTISKLRSQLESLKSASTLIKKELENNPTVELETYDEVSDKLQREYEMYKTHLESYREITQKSNNNYQNSTNCILTKAESIKTIVEEVLLTIVIPSPIGIAKFIFPKRIQKMLSAIDNIITARQSLDIVINNINENNLPCS